MMLEVRDGRPSFADLGPGTCPAYSRDDKRISFLFQGEQAGIWVMQADGSARQRVGEASGAPFWSTDGREFLMDSSQAPPSFMMRISS
jgi:hypothetical protein